MDENILGDADDDANILSKFFFYWVNPLIDKGIAGKLKKLDDLFDLPASLNIGNLADRFYQSINDRKSLFRALHKTFGREFYAIGLLRLLADMSGFCGPILLGGLLTSADNSDVNQDQRTSYKPYLYALGLFTSTLLGTLKFRFGELHFTVSIHQISSCLFWHTLQLAHVDDNDENAYRSGHQNLQSFAGSENARQFTGYSESNVHRCRSHCELVHQLPLILEHSVSAVHHTVLTVHTDRRSVHCRCGVRGSFNTHQPMDCCQNWSVFTEAHGR